MSGTVQALSYGLVYVLSWLVLRRSLADSGREVRVTAAAAALWGVVAVSSVVGLVWPPWLAAGARELDPVRHGQVWRLVTSMFLQDGGVRGAVFNLVTLAVTLLLVGPTTRARTLVGGFVAAGLVCNVLVLLLLRQDGAGSSMATMCVAVVATTVAVLRPGSPVSSKVAFGVLVLVALVLGAALDQHGFAVTLALLVGLVVAFVRPAARLSPSGPSRTPSGRAPARGRPGPRRS